jgi:hypothetical protein
MSRVELAVLMIAGRRRERAQRVLEALERQTCRDRLEILVADMASESPQALLPPEGISTRIFPIDAQTSWGEARAMALEQAQAPLVAYIEDHCYPSIEWAAAILEAHSRGWAAVGYAFTNANPETYISRASLMNDYGLWIHPASGGRQRLLSYNNVSYQRESLLGLDGDPSALLSSDYHIHELFHRRGQITGVAAGALAAHENFDRLSGILQANHHYCRVLAANRVERGDWSWPLRLFYGVATPVGAPLIALGRLVWSLRNRPSLWLEFLITLPVVLLISIWTAIGEARGYVFGRGRSEEALSHWEVNASRRREA